MENFTLNLTNVMSNEITSCPLPIDLLGIEKLFTISLILSCLLFIYYVGFQDDKHKYFNILRRIFLIICLLSFSITINLYFLTT